MAGNLVTFRLSSEVLNFLDNPTYSFGLSRSALVERILDSYFHRDAGTDKIRDDIRKISNILFSDEYEFLIFIKLMAFYKQNRDIIASEFGEHLIGLCVKWSENISKMLGVSDETQVDLKSSQKSRITIYLSEQVLTQIDHSVKEKIYENRSVAIREMLSVYFSTTPLDVHVHNILFYTVLSEPGFYGWYLGCRIWITLMTDEPWREKFADMMVSWMKSLPYLSVQSNKTLPNNFLQILMLPDDEIKRNFVQKISKYAVSSAPVQTATAESDKAGRKETQGMAANEDIDKEAALVTEQ